MIGEGLRYRAVIDFQLPNQEFIAFPMAKLSVQQWWNKHHKAFWLKHIKLPMCISKRYQKKALGTNLCQHNTRGDKWQREHHTNEEGVINKGSEKPNKQHLKCM